jgi:hypothetical protein
VVILLGSESNQASLSRQSIDEHVAKHLETTDEKLVSDVI